MGHNEQQRQATEPLRAVVYVRISDDPEGTERGVDRQEADCRAYAAAHGWEVSAVFRENDTSAFKQRTITLPSGERVRRVVRPQFRAMDPHRHHSAKSGALPGCVPLVKPSCCETTYVDDLYSRS
ncbi:recombinase family protein [uncultured Leifsonia sp.]|uniref:recombinase family protein n=1 Tax=uncultured Leifsonia sp. TaxID=340359 RepID=UPI0025D2D0CF|nr:recombinase family protein [uncultured Leifsonia sp.]